MRLYSRNVTFNLAIEGDHKLGLLVVRQNVAVVAVVLGRLLEDAGVFFTLRLGLEIR